MLEEILDYIHNYFEVGTKKGPYTIESGSIEVNFLQNGQYFRIIGSTFNDGVHQYPVDSLHDEEFVGEIRAMAVPPAVIAISNEISDWMEKYGSGSTSPYQSESFGGYSYSKASGGTAGSTGSTWQSVFAARLNRWRKIS